MKKFILTMVAVIGFCISTFATEPFRWSGCDYNNQRIELYTDGSATFIYADGRRAEGNYTWDRQNGIQGFITINLNTGQTLRGDVGLAGSGYNFFTSGWEQNATVTIEGKGFHKRNCK